MNNRHFYHQNLNKSGHWLWNSRWKYWLGTTKDDAFSGQWLLGKHARRTGLTITTDFVFERELTFFIGIWGLFCLYLAYGSRRLPSWSYKHGDREIGFSIFDNAIWTYPWRDPDKWTSKKPSCYRFSPVDFLLGRMKLDHENEEQMESTVSIELPEGTYRANVTKVTRTWKRRRWPGRKVKIGFNVDLLKPIPVPGKGENPWDMGDDAVYSISVSPASDPNEAIDALLKNINRDRERYGGMDWLPQSPSP